VELHVWRRYGDAVYTLVTFAVFGFETLALGALSVSFLLGKSTGIASTAVESILFAVVTSTASALALLGLYLLVYHFVSALRDRLHGERMDAWTERWIGLALEPAPAGGPGDGRTPGRLPGAAVEALLGLLEAVKGEEGERLKGELERHHVDRSFLRRLRIGHLASRLDAIERLGKARLPHALDPLLGLTDHPKPVIRRMAVRAAAGTLATMTPEEPDLPVERFIESLKGSTLRPGVIEEALLLLESRSARVLRRILAEPDLPDSLLWVVIETVGRLGLADMAEEVAASTRHPDPELRAAAFRALRRLELVPDSAQQPLLGALGDQVDFVRVQACHAAAFLPAEEALDALWPRLEDESWWVRRAAAAAMASHGDEGLAAVTRAAETHHDRSARDMAVQILLEAGALDPVTARQVKGVA
jgi:HEAT repeat protein